MLEFKKDTFNAEEIIQITNKRNNTNVTIDKEVLEKWLKSNKQELKVGR